jgi:hypothetical protein
MHTTVLSLIGKVRLAIVGPPLCMTEIRRRGMFLCSPRFLGCRSVRSDGVPTREGSATPRPTGSGSGTLVAEYNPVHSHWKVRGKCYRRDPTRGADAGAFPRPQMSPRNCYYNTQASIIEKPDLHYHSKGSIVCISPRKPLLLSHLHTDCLVRKGL